MIWEGAHAWRFHRELARLGVARWSDVADARTGEWLDWDAFRRKFGAAASLEDAYDQLRRHLDTDARAGAWRSMVRGHAAAARAASAEPREEATEHAYERILASRPTATCFGGTEYLVLWADGSQTWEAEKVLIWRDPRHKHNHESAAARKREREGAARMTGLRRDMEAARRDARRPRDLREALERAAGGEAWLQRALEGPATCPQAVNAMARLGEVFATHAAQAADDKGRRAVDTNQPEQTARDGFMGLGWEEEAVATLLPGGKESVRGKDGKMEERSRVGLEGSGVCRGEAAAREREGGSLPPTWPRGLVCLQGASVPPPPTACAHTARRPGGGAV